MSRRKSDTQENGIPRSSSRTYERDGYWFYSSREGECGPFENEAAAAEDLQAYIELIDLRMEDKSSTSLH